MRGAVVGKIVASKSTKYPVGSNVYAPSGWTELAVFDDSNKDLMKVELPKDGKLTDALGVLGWFACSFMSYLTMHSPDGLQGSSTTQNLFVPCYGA